MRSTYAETDSGLGTTALLSFQLHLREAQRMTSTSIPMKTRLCLQLHLALPLHLFMPLLNGKSMVIQFAKPTPPYPIRLQTEEVDRQEYAGLQSGVVWA